MRIDNTPSVDIIWKQMDDILPAFRFQRFTTGDQRIYEEPTTRTLLVFPRRADSEPVERHHLSMARMNIALNSVVSEHDFDSAIYRAIDPVRVPVSAEPVLVAA